MSRIILMLLSVLTTGLAGCAPAPSFYLAGSYFPSWLLYTVIGIVGAVLLRVLFIRLSLDDALPLRLLFYTCIALIIALALEFYFY